MSIFVSGIRQPFGEPEKSALEAARKLCGLSAGDGEASVYRVSIDARHGRVHQVYTIALDGLDNEEGICSQPANALCAL